MIDESLQNALDAQNAQKYFTKYKKYCEAFEKSVVSRAINLSEHHIVQLGKQLEAFELYAKICENSGSLNTLGEIPKIALDVITAVMSNSVLPVIASTQVIEQQRQMIYFKNLRADNTKGNLTAGQVILDPKTGMKTPKGYASNRLNGLEMATTALATVDYTFTLPALPVQSQFMKIEVESDATVFAEDVGPRGADKNIGTLLGAGVSGTVNYTSGVVVLKFAVQPTVAKKIYVSYQQNMELAADLPKMTSFLDQTDVEAQAYVLKTVVGMFQQYALKKTFGDSALEDTAMDLTKEINAEIGGDFISKYLVAAMGSTQFSLTAPAGVSEKLHRESYAFRMSDAEAVMLGNAGRGTIKTMIVGREHAALVRGLDGFNLLSDGGSVGPHIFGTYKGITYIRVPEDALLGAKKGIALYTGSSAIESAGVYCPFMPLTVRQAPANNNNPLQDQTVAATLAATKVVVPQFITAFDVVA